jgi:hypothetical protein
MVLDVQLSTMIRIACFASYTSTHMLLFSVFFFSKQKCCCPLSRIDCASLLEVDVVPADEVVLSRHGGEVAVEGVPLHVVGAPQVVPHHTAHSEGVDVGRLGPGLLHARARDLEAEGLAEVDDGGVHRLDGDRTTGGVVAHAAADGDTVEVLGAAGDDVVCSLPLAQLLHLPRTGRPPFCFPRSPHPR